MWLVEKTMPYVRAFLLSIALEVVVLARPICIWYIVIRFSCRGSFVRMRYELLIHDRARGASVSLDHVGRLAAHVVCRLSSQMSGPDVISNPYFGGEHCGLWRSPEFLASRQRPEMPSRWRGFSQEWDVSDWWVRSIVIEAMGNYVLRGCVDLFLPDPRAELLLPNRPLWKPSFPPRSNCRVNEDNLLVCGLGKVSRVVPSGLCLLMKCSEMFCAKCCITWRSWGGGMEDLEYQDMSPQTDSDDTSVRGH